MKPVHLPMKPQRLKTNETYKQDPSLFLLRNVPRRCVMVETAHAPRALVQQQEKQSSILNIKERSTEQAQTGTVSSSTATRTTKWLYLAAIIKPLVFFFKYEIVPPHIPVSTLGWKLKGLFGLRHLDIQSQNHLTFLFPLRSL